MKTETGWNGKIRLTLLNDRSKCDTYFIVTCLESAKRWLQKGGKIGGNI
jgi:hypothetical protein